MDLMPILIFGAGSLARLLVNLIKQEGHHFVLAIIVDDNYVDTTEDLMGGIPVISLSEAVRRFKNKNIGVVVTLGYASMRNRAKVCEHIISLGLPLQSYIARSAFVSDAAVIDDGCVILPRVVIEPGCHIGKNNIIWSNATVCHDTRIGCHNFIAAGTVIGGEVSIGDCCFLGFNSVVLQQLQVRSETLLGASSLLTVDSVKAGKYIGSPAKKVSEHNLTGIMLK